MTVAGKCCDQFFFLLEHLVVKPVLTFLPLLFLTFSLSLSRKFARPSEVFYHVHCEHIMTASFPAVSSCQWGGPEGKGPGCLSKRPKLSLLTHLQVRAVLGLCLSSWTFSNMLSLPFDTGLSLQRKQPQAGAAAPAAAAGDGHDEYPAGGAAGTSGLRAERRHARHQTACGQLCCKWAETLMENTV